VEVSVRRYVEREFLELFAQSRRWQGAAITLEEVRLSTNSIRLAIACPDLSEADLLIAMEVESGWLTAGVTSPGWTERLGPDQRQVLTTAIIGLYKTAGVDLVRQQIEDQFTPPVPRYEISGAGLVLWPDREWDVEVLYQLHDGPWIAPQFVRGLARQVLPTLARSRLLFGEVPVAWDRWVATWHQDWAAGPGLPQEFLAPVRVLPKE
jgi:hypothetical protein